ncbi:protein mono-ADP-ribosyltransferase PARP15-like [Salminus brasiliensis]|uniref:protein mono-ADP-ribosyltransferase PARP15-like n=1 Tax=Salminus brasiliensis TaxID=930266 RepID=UPI003B82DD70
MGERTLIIQGLPDDLDCVRSTLASYFKSKRRSGGEAARIQEHPEDRRTALLIYLEGADAHQVIQQAHHLRGAVLTTALFYSGFQKALTGETPALPGIPTNATIPVCEELLDFIENSEPIRKDFQNRLRMVHAKALFGKTTSPRSIVLEVAVDKKSLAALQLGPTWEYKAKSEAQAFLTKFSVAELSAEVDVWKKVKNSCLSLVSFEADISFKEATSKIVIVGLKQVVSTLLDKFRRLLENAAMGDSFGRNVTDELLVESIALRSVQEMEFIESCMNFSEIPDIRSTNTTVQVSRTQSWPCLKVTGKKENVKDAVRKLKQQLSSIVTEKLTYSKAGEAKILEKHEVNIKARCKEWQCKVFFSPERRSKFGPARRFTHKISSHITLTIAEGDLHQYSFDTLVFPVTANQAFDNPTAQQFLKAGGSQIQEVFNKLQKEKKTLAAGDVLLSNPGNLKTKSLIYAVLPERNQHKSLYHLKSAIYYSLYKAEHQNSTSVAMPVPGYRTFGFSIKESCTAIREAILHFSSVHRNTPKNVKNIFLVDSCVGIVEEINSVVAHLQPSKGAQAACGKMPENQVLTRQPVSLATATTAVTFPAATVVVYGTSPAGLAKAKKLLNDLISDECFSKDVRSSFLSKLQEAEKEAIVALSRNNQVHILLASSDKLIVSGKKDDVLDAVLNISTFIQAAKDRETHECEKERLTETVCWEVAKGETWVPLDCNINYQLELAFHRKERNLICEAEGEVYTVNFRSMNWLNSKGKSSRIKRSLIGDSETAIISPPLTWTKMDGANLKIILLHPHSAEYDKVKTDFLRSKKCPALSGVYIEKIVRIQNQQQWQRYCVLKQAVDKKYPNQINESFLYHGTTKEICQKIYENGFNRSFCGRNGVTIGHGTYFAKKARYSCSDHFSEPDEDDLKYVFRARVVTGLPCQGRRGMKEPDPLNSCNPQAGLHDCAVDNLQNPMEFVVFSDAGAYPEYLIVFEDTVKYR